MQVDIGVGKLLKGATGQFWAEIRAADANVDDISYRLTGAAQPVAAANFVTDLLDPLKLLLDQGNALIRFAAGLVAALSAQRGMQYSATFRVINHIATEHGGAVSI